MKPQRDLCDPARPGCAEDWNGPNGPKNGPKWPEEWPEWPATEKMPMIVRRCRVRPVRKAHAYPSPRPTSAWGEGGGEGRWLEVAIAPSPVALRAPASPRGGERRGWQGRNRRGERRALFVSGYTRKAAGYAEALSRYLESLDFSDGARAQSVRISACFGRDMLPPNSKRPRESPRPVADRERPVRMHTRRTLVVNSMLGNLT
jgi:hypothetical protein